MNRRLSVPAQPRKSWSPASPVATKSPGTSSQPIPVIPTPAVDPKVAESKSADEEEPKAVAEDPVKESQQTQESAIQETVRSSTGKGDGAGASEKEKVVDEKDGGEEGKGEIKLKDKVSAVTDKVKELVIGGDSHSKEANEDAAKGVSEVEPSEVEPKDTGTEAPPAQASTSKTGDTTDKDVAPAVPAVTSTTTVRKRLVSNRGAGVTPDKTTATPSKTPKASDNTGASSSTKATPKITKSPAAKPSPLAIQTPASKSSQPVKTPTSLKTKSPSSQKPVAGVGASSSNTPAKSVQQVLLSPISAKTKLADGAGAGKSPTTRKRLTSNGHKTSPTVTTPLRSPLSAKSPKDVSYASAAKFSTPSKAGKSTSGSVVPPRSQSTTANKTPRPATSAETPGRRPVSTITSPGATSSRDPRSPGGTVAALRPQLTGHTASSLAKARHVPPVQDDQNRLTRSLGRSAGARVHPQMSGAKSSPKEPPSPAAPSKMSASTSMSRLMQGTASSRSKAIDAPVADATKTISRSATTSRLAAKTSSQSKDARPQSQTPRVQAKKLPESTPSGSNVNEGGAGGAQKEAANETPSKKQESGQGVSTAFSMKHNGLTLFLSTASDGDQIDSKHENGQDGPDRSEPDESKVQDPRETPAGAGSERQEDLSLRSESHPEEQGVFGDEQLAETGKKDVEAHGQGLEDENLMRNSAEEEPIIASNVTTATEGEEARQEKVTDTDNSREESNVSLEEIPDVS